MATELKKDNKVVALYSALLSRAQLAARLGLQYDDNRNIYQALGYKTTLRYEDYATQYLRQDIAKAIINRPVQATWRGTIQVIEAGTKEETEFESAWKDLWARLQLKSRFIRLDKLASVGRYGVLLLGLDDVKNSQDWRTPVKPGTRNLLYVKPLSEGSAKISNYDQDPRSPRYSLPNIYDISTSLGQEDGPVLSLAIQAHYSRVIHVPGEMLESEVDGVPVLQSVFNRLQDLEKLIGASAEMFWRGARPGYKGTVDKDFTLTPESKDATQSQLDEYEHNLRRFLLLEGIDVSPLAPQVASPIEHVDVQLQMISAVTGIPKRILVGSERGELASSEDKNTWLELVQSRQKDYAEIQILQPFIDCCVKYGILPKPSSEVTVVWADPYAPSEKERAEIGKIRASALQSYMNNPAAEMVIPREVFIQYMLGLEEEDLQYVDQLLNKSVAEEQQSLQGTGAASIQEKEIPPTVQLKRTKW